MTTDISTITSAPHTDAAGKAINMLDSDEDVLWCTVFEPPLNRPHIYRHKFESSALLDDRPWTAWVPPTRHEHYDIDGWSQLGMAGTTYWPTWREAFDAVFEFVNNKEEYP